MAGTKVENIAHEPPRADSSAWVPSKNHPVDHPTRPLEIDTNVEQSIERPSSQPVAPGEMENLSFLDPPESLAELGFLAHYRVIRLVGKGGMGLVFQAQDPRLNRTVAIKVMRPELAVEPVARARFLREARSTASVRSDHIVGIHEVGTFKDLPYLATEFLQGKSLDLLLYEGAKPTVNEILDLAMHVAKGLDAAHRGGLIHRDIKPANIWVEDDPRRFKILDFGLARSTEQEETLTHCGMILGTPAYMAPEQADGQPLDGRCDLFSLGCVLYEAAASHRPFEGTSTVAILKATAMLTPTPLNEIAPEVPQPLAELIMRMLAKCPADRPTSAAAVVEELEVITGVRASSGKTRQVSNPRLIALSKTDPKPRRHRKMAIGGALLAVGAIALGAVWFRSDSIKAGDDGDEAAVAGNAGNGTPAAAEKKPRASRSSPAQGVTDDEIVFGMTGPFDGPEKELGQSMRLGIQTCFNAVNYNGGVGGRKLKLVVLDDRYDPPQALANMKKLDETYKVFGIIGNVGTPTSAKTVQYALDKPMLFMGALTGASSLRKPSPDRYVFNYRASYAEETAAIVKYLLDVKRLTPDQIAVFAQDDEFGQAGVDGVEKALRGRKHSRGDILQVRYEQKKGDVQEAVATILKHDGIRAVVMVATSKPAAKFIHDLKQAKRDLIFTNVSFVNADALASRLHDLGSDLAKGVIITQVVPHPREQSSAVIKFRDDLKNFAPHEQPTFVALEGYLSAMLLVEGLKIVGDDLTTESLVDALHSVRDFDIGLGTVLHYTPSEHQASHKVWGIVLDENGRHLNLDLD